MQFKTTKKGNTKEEINDVCYRPKAQIQRPLLTKTEKQTL
ncbi:hypothetical protein JCM19301_3261 [Jejuia pallidilutea]|uniref:Uncharacterized protein n=1 Tax=Jejuia pallidilutea TaxID=504487 RepID=A0A090VZK4_9FLAO|nr:hypothetical protein JCM19301_3261 [Jejuia pallidilutea]